MGNNVIAIFRKEVSAFFNSLVAYIVLAAFLSGVGFFFWGGSGNVLETQDASMDGLFFFAPWFFLFLIPAITMRSFAEEFKQGTIEMLSSKPVTDWQIILGKFLAANALVVFALLPTLVYYFSLQGLAEPAWSMDSGPIIGAYIGLWALGSIFCSLGLLSSSITSNQVEAFVLGVFLCFAFYFGFDFLAQAEALSAINLTIEKIGINSHYQSISLGVIDTRDIIYFVSFVLIALLLTRIALSYRKR